MANYDHKARPCLSVPLGHAPRVPPAADPPAGGFTSSSLRLSTLDDVALALYALAQLRLEDERYRDAARHPDASARVPLPPSFRQGITVAMQCLEQYARQLGVERTLGV